MPGKPPKPPNREAAPRYKSRKKHGGTGTRELGKLRALSKAQPNFDHLIIIHQQTSSEKNDRGAAILIGTTIENVLEYALLQVLKRGRTAELFGVRAPLGDFYGKILMGYALDIYGDEMFWNLEILRNLRNAFAHSKIPITFETPEVADVCALFRVPTLLPPFTVGKDKEDASGLKGLSLFRFAADRIGHNLIWAVQPGVRYLQEAAYPAWIDPRRHEIVVRFRPLP